MSSNPDIITVAPLSRPELIGLVLGELRRANGLTQDQLAKTLGVSRQHVVEVEQGHTTRALELIFNAFAHFGYALQPVQVMDSAIPTVKRPSASLKSAS